MALDALEAAAAGVAAIANRIRSAIRPAESLAENRANNTLYVVADLLDTLATTLQRLKCVGESVGAGGSVASVCTTWRIVGRDGGVVVIRLRPETVIRFEGGRLFFHRDHVRMEADAARVKICKWGYCKEFSTTNREEVIRELPQIIYILRFVGNAVRKTAEAAQVCARREAPECARL